MRIGLYTENFLEPTHHAIAQVIKGVSDCTYKVATLDILDYKRFHLGNKLESIKKISRDQFDEVMSFFYNVDVMHIAFDGLASLKACEVACRMSLQFILSFQGGHDTNYKAFVPWIISHLVFLANHAAYITVVCEQDKQALINIGVKNRIVVVPVPIDEKNLPAANNINRHHLVFLGRLVEKKGCDIAIRAFSLLPSHYTLTIIGDGPEKNRLFELAQALCVEDRIKWLGTLPLEEALNVLSECSFLWHPARKSTDGNAEGTPQAILYAQAMGVPVITTNSGNISSIVRDKETGILIESDNAEALAKATIGLGIKDIASMRDAAKTYVFSHHSSRTVITIWENLYRQCIKDKCSFYIDSPQAFNSRLLQCGDARSLKALDLALCELSEKNNSLELLNFGGQGFIYTMYCKKYKSKVTIKVPNYARQNESKYEVIRRNIRKEGALLSSFNLSKSCYFPSLYNYDKNNGEYIIREYVNGRCLSEWVKDLNRDQIDEFVRKCIKMSINVFDVAHQQNGVVFRDYKCKNIIVERDPSQPWKIIDFGSARPETEMYSKRTNKSFSRLGAGKWCFWPPEQLMETPGLCDRRADYFAFGVICFMIITKRLPYSNKEKEAKKVLNFYSTEYRKAVATLRKYGKKSKLQQETLEFIINCLNPLAEERPSCFTEEILSNDRL